MEELRQNVLIHGWRSSYERVDVYILILSHPVFLSGEVIMCYTGSGANVT